MSTSVLTNIEVQVSVCFHINSFWITEAAVAIYFLLSFMRQNIVSILGFLPLEFHHVCF